MSEFDPWVTFASAWIAGRTGDPRHHGESDQQFASRCADTAGAVADAMMRALAMRKGGPYPAAVPVRNGPSAITRRALQEVLDQSGLLGSETEGLPPPLPPPYAPPPAGSPGSCQRAFNNAKRGTGQDCPGQYDPQGICTVCRLPTITPAEIAQQRTISGIVPPGVG
jgi:hypothetical protein